MSGRHKAVDETGVIPHDLIFKGCDLVWLGYAVDLLKQRKPKGLAVPLLTALAGPIGSKLFAAAQRCASAMVELHHLLFW